MVVLMEYAPGVGVTTKRKGEEEPRLFAFPDDGDSGSVPLSCSATKMRRLESAGTVHDVPAAAAVGTEGDVMMAEEPPAPSPGTAEGEKRAVAVYDPAVDSALAGGRLRLLGQWRLRPWAPLNAGAEWIHNMLREADGRTVRAVLSSPQEEGGADLALVPWGTAPWSLGARHTCRQRRIRRPRPRRRWTGKRTPRERPRWTSRMRGSIISPRRPGPAAVRGTCASGRSTAWRRLHCRRFARRARLCGRGEPRVAVRLRNIVLCRCCLVRGLEFRMPPWPEIDMLIPD